MRWLDFPFFRFLIFLVAGILAGRYTGLPGNGEELTVLLMTAGIIIIAAGRFVPVLLWLLLPCLGYGLYSVRDKKFSKPLPGQGVLVLQGAGETASSRTRYEAELIAIMDPADSSWHPDDRRILVYIQDSVRHLPGQRIYFHTPVIRPGPPLHPYSFDYSSYLRHNYLHGQLFLSGNSCRLLDTVSTLRTRRSIFQYRVRKLIHNWIPDRTNAILLSGMILGVKRGLDPSVRHIYSVTGSMHVLAVSGLHVGLVYLVLSFLTAWMPNKPPWMGIRWVLFLVLLTSYAAMADFSPSVIRAVIFVMVFRLAKLIQRPNPLPHVLYLTAFLMLLTDPFQLFQVSFQLSFVAVLGILIFMPLLRNWFSHRIRWIDYTLRNIAVSLSVQLTTLVLGIVYFNQVSFSFLIGAVMVVPAAFILLLLAGMLFLFQSFPGIHSVVVKLISLILEVQTEGLGWLASLPGAYLENIYLPPWLILPVPVLAYLFLCLCRRMRVRIFYTLLWSIFISAVLVTVYGIGASRKEHLAVFIHDKTWFVTGIRGTKGRLILGGPADGYSDWMHWQITPWFVRQGIRFPDTLELELTLGKGYSVKFDSPVAVFSLKSDNFRTWLQFPDRDSLIIAPGEDRYICIHPCP